MFWGLTTRTGMMAASAPTYVQQQFPNLPPGPINHGSEPPQGDPNHRGWYVKGMASSRIFFFSITGVSRQQTATNFVFFFTFARNIRNTTVLVLYEYTRK